MKICVVCPYFHSVKYKMKFRPDIFEVCRMLVKRGHNVVALASKTYGAPSHEVIDGVEVYRVPSLSLPNMFYFVPSFFHLITELSKICREHNIEILHFWDYEYLTSTSAIFLRRKLKNLPFVLTVIAFPGLNWHYGLKTIDTIGLIYTYTIGKAILKTMDHVVLLGRSLFEYALEIGVPYDKISINSFGIDFEAFRPKKQSDMVRRELGISPSDKVIIYVGRLAHIKGIAYLLEAAKHLCKSMENLKFLIVGDGPLRSRLEKMKNKQIIFAGWRNDVADLLNISDIFVLPSLSEGLPVSLLEAYTLSKPVIATTVGAVPDLVINNKTGLLIEPRNREKIEKAISYLLKNPELARIMGNNGKRFVEKHHNWDCIMNKYEEIYNSLTH